MRWICLVLLVLLVACGRPVNAREAEPGVVAISCPSGPRGCRQRASESCPGGYDVVDARGRQSVAYVGELYVRCRGPVDPQALGYRDCMADASCETGDRCVWSKESLGRCVGR